MKKLIVVICLLVSSMVYADGLTVITDEWAPYEFKTGVPGNEKIEGFSTEVVLAVLGKLGVGLKGNLRQYPWARCEVMIVNGDADLLFTAANKPEREKVTNYCYEPLVSSSWSFFIRKEDEGKLKFDSLEDLKGQKVGVVRAFSYTPEFWDYVNKNGIADEVVSDELNLKKLVGKRFNYTIMDSLNGLYLIKQMGLTDKVVMLPKPLGKTDLFCVFSKVTTDNDSVNAFAAALKAFKQTKDYQLIHFKYFGK